MKKMMQILGIGIAIWIVLMVFVPVVNAIPCGDEMCGEDVSKTYKENGILYRQEISHIDGYYTISRCNDDGYGCVVFEDGYMRF
jgi:hypothetical protein